MVLGAIVCPKNRSRDVSARLREIRVNIRSGLLQLTDLLIGAVNYANRADTASPAKLSLVNRIRERSGVSLTQTTLLSELKMNIFKWRAQA